MNSSVATDRPIDTDKEMSQAFVGGLTTLVNATSETAAGGERATGLASLAKLFSGGK